ncbi:MAG: sulfatase [Candidatus Aminicenantes bacterium]|nr:sulfatase [Candidatus Aminicenantes bacterium]
MKKLIYFVILVLVSLSFIVYFSTTSNKNKPENIILITIDTLRADHMGCYNYPWNTTPFMDSLAEKGVVFENAISQSATTCPSITSIFTGLYPSEHKIQANGFILDDSFLTLAEILKSRGYFTAAFTSTDRHFLASNLDQGFDKYEEPEDTKKKYDFSYRPGEYTIEKAMEWLKKFDRKKKLFLWIHLFDPHQPYLVSKREVDEYLPKKEKSEFRKYLKEYNIRAKCDFYRKFKHLERQIIRYDTELRSNDNHVREFFEFADKLGINKNSLWIISGDHGEGLGQHNWSEHAMKIYQEEIHVPLIFYSPGKKWNFRYPGTVENFNIFSTLVDLTGDLKEKYGQFKISSKSLKNILESEGKIKLDQFAFSERQSLGYWGDGERKLQRYKIFYSEGEKYAIQNGEYKYIMRTKAEDELFNLKNDPYELNNLISSEEERSKNIKLKKRLLLLISRIKRESGLSKKLVNEKTIERLKSLGYVF